MRIQTGALRIFSAAAVILWTACTKTESNLPNYGAVPAFQMTDSEGHGFDSKVLKGKLWIADFIYASCPGPCSRMTSQMHKVQRQVSGQKDVWLVSISVDPQHDSAAALNEFAHRFGGPSDQWVFLTGSPETVHVLAHDVFHVGDLIGKMDHSTKFTLVDKEGHIRGYYSSVDADDMPAMLRDVSALRKESS
ncbi:MAG: SCO family protein [Bryobacteraceae bacterium]